jgi:acetyl esterase/lipase
MRPYVIETPAPIAGAVSGTEAPMASQRLTIEGQFGTTIPASLQRVHGRELVICLPGLRYSNEMPVMYVVRRLMAARGADVMTIDYRYDTNEDFLARPDDEQFDWIGNDARAALGVALKTGSSLR